MDWFQWRYLFLLFLFFLFADTIIWPWLRLKLKSSRAIKALAPYTGHVINIVSAMIIIYFIKLQLDNNWFIYSGVDFKLNDALTFFFGLLGLYGIYFGFLQFLVGYDKNDMYLGRSKANQLIKDMGKNILFNNIVFKATLLCLITIPFLFQINFTADYKNLLLAVWQTSVVYLLLIYLILLSRSLHVIRLMLFIKENDDFILKDEIEQEIQDQYLNYFTNDFKNKRSVFYYALGKDLESIKDSELVSFYDNVFQKTNDTDIAKQLKNEDKHFIYRYYRRFLEEKWDYLMSAQLSFNDLLSFYRRDMDLLFYLIDNGDTTAIKDMRGPNRGFSIHHLLFDHVFKKAKTTEDMDELILEVKNYINEDKIVEYFKGFKRRVYERCIDNYFSENNLVTTTLINELVKEDGDDRSSVIFNILVSHYGYIDEELNHRQTEKMVDMLTLLKRKYRMAYVFYQLFYPSRGEWDSNIHLYKDLLKNINVPADDREFSHQVAKIINDTHIGHEISYETCQWIFATKNDYFSYALFKQVHDKGLPLFKVLFVQQYLSHPHHIFGRFNNQMDVDSSCRTVMNREYLDIGFEHPDSLNEIVITYALKQILDWIYHLEGETFKYLRWEGLFILEETHRGFLSSIEENQFITGEIFGENLCKFYVLMLNNSVYEKLFSDEDFLNLFLRKIREILAVDHMSVRELVDQLVAEIEPWKRIGKYEVEIIYTRLRSLLDSKYKPFQTELTLNS